MWIISPKNQVFIIGEKTGAHILLTASFIQITNPLPLFSATWRKLALSVNYEKYKVAIYVVYTMFTKSECLYLE